MWGILLVNMAYLDSKHNKIGTPEIIKDKLTASEVVEYLGYKKLDDLTDDDFKQTNIDDIGTFFNRNFNLI